MRPLALGAKRKEGSGSNACWLPPTPIDSPSYSYHVSAWISQRRSDAVEIPSILFLISFSLQLGTQGGVKNEINARSEGKP
jgi:hypothetical protein